MWEMDYDAAANYWVEKDKDAEKLDSKSLKSNIEGFLVTHKICTLATASADMVRNTPIEYNYVDGCFYFFSEGGLKFKNLKENKNVALAMFDDVTDLKKYWSIQVQGVASMVEPFSEEYLKLLEYKKIPVESIKKLPQPINLIKVTPKSYDVLDFRYHTCGFGSRQHLDV